MKEKIKKLVHSETDLEQINAKLQDAITQLENRAASGDQDKRALEGELQRIQMNVTDKDTEHQVCKLCWPNG